MADVRSGVGAATTGVFGGPVGNQVGTPLYVDLSTGDISVLLPGDVIYTIPTGTTSINVEDADLQLANQVFARRNTQLSVAVAGSGTAIVTASVQVDDSNLQNAVRSFLPIVSYPQDVADANRINADRALERTVDMRAQTENDVRIREASDILKQRVFSPDPKPVVDVADANLHIADRVLDRSVDRLAQIENDNRTREASDILKQRVFSPAPKPVTDLADAGLHLSNRVFDRYIPPLQVVGSSVTAVSTVTVENADLQNAVRSFHPIISYPQDLGDAGIHLAVRTFDRYIAPLQVASSGVSAGVTAQDSSLQIANRVFGPNITNPVDVSDGNLHGADRVFDRTVDMRPQTENDNRVREVSDLLKTRVFYPQPPRVTDLADASLHIADRVFDRQIDRLPQVENDNRTQEASNILKQRVFNDRMPPARVTTFSDADLHLQIRSFDRTIGIMPQATVVAFTVNESDRSLVIAQRSFGNHDPVQPVPGNADRLIEDRVFDRDVNLLPLLENQIRVQEVSDLLKTRSFSPDPPQAVLGNASMILEAMAFLPRPRAPYWT